VPSIENEGKKFLVLNPGAN